MKQTMQKCAALFITLSSLHAMASGGGGTGTIGTGNAPLILIDSEFSKLRSELIFDTMAFANPPKNKYCKLQNKQYQEEVAYICDLPILKNTGYQLFINAWAESGTLTSVIYNGKIVDYEKLLNGFAISKDTFPSTHVYDWRYAVVKGKKVPFALIFRIEEIVPKELSDEETGDGLSDIQYTTKESLLVIKLDGDQTRAIAKVKTNKEAHRVADQILKP